MWQIRDRKFIWGQRTYLMAVLNITPDSFSDGGLFGSTTEAIDHAESLIPYADILDIGGESTRPGAKAVSVAEELKRVIPAITSIRPQYPNLPISIDTTKVAVAAAALDAGADIINDVSAGRFEPEILSLAAKRQVPLILMHMQGEPRTMQQHPHYDDLIAEVMAFFTERIAAAVDAGVDRSLIAIDPGIGFGKTLEHNLELLRRLPEFRSLGCPMLVGVSRKSFIGKLCDRPIPTERVFGTAAACTVSIAGGADILRVHDAREIKDVCLVSDAIYRKVHG